ncbi:MAG: hypothetical protein ABIS50_14365 [Luteolibacter sp.]|uniref:hypothetical protein n=1 Tax=Luteolibacter sp. TaxID=1962973 RepID=UPI0032634928
MKTILLRCIFLGVIGMSCAFGQTYTNYIRQFQMPSGVTWDASDTVAATGTQDSALAINPGGARFDLWTINSSPYTEYLLDSSYVGTYVPIAQVVIDTEDTYGKDLTATGPVPVNLPSKIRRTRADRPFTVYVSISGLLSGADDPPASKSVNLLRHVQSYGTGVGVGIDRTQATLKTQSSITTNGQQVLSYSLTGIAGSNLKKLRGEERFSVFSIADPAAPTALPASQLASQFIQVWPVADGNMTGIVQDQIVRFAMPAITITYHDIYPGSSVYAQVYKGERVAGKVGTVLTGSLKVNTGSEPLTEVLTPTNYDQLFTTDGRWTIELVTAVPFGTGTEYMLTSADLPAYVTFTVDRTIEMNGSFTTIE